MGVEVAEEKKKTSGDLKTLQMATGSHINSVCFVSVRFLFVAAFHHFPLVLCKSYLIFPVKRMTGLNLAPFRRSLSFLVPSSSRRSAVLLLPPRSELLVGSICAGRKE